MAAVAYREQGTAAAARRRLRPHGRKVRTHRLVPHENARQTVFELIDAVQAVGDGVLHVTGWAEAFGGEDGAERIYDLNFLRESVVEGNATQVWWMPVAFRDAFMLRAPDTWSVIRLKFRVEDEREYALLSDRIAEEVRSWLNLDVSSPIPKKSMARFELFWMYSRKYSREDMQSIAHMTGLKRLELIEAEFEDLSPLRHCTQLQELDLSDSVGEDFSSLSGVTSLVALHLAQSTVRDISFVERMRALRYLNLRSTKVSRLAALSNLPELQTLNIANTSVIDLRPLHILGSLTTLHLGDLRVRSSKIDDLQNALPSCLILRSNAI